MTVRIYLDSKVFIDAFENDDVPVTRGRRVLEHVRNGGAIGVISELVVAELLTKPLETGDTEMYEAYVSLFHSSRTIETYPIDQRVLVRAARLRAATKSLKMPDAIHAATAQIQSCAAFVTADRRLLSALGINAVPLDTSTVENIRTLA